ncbi:uncharacterized protein LOC142608413 [Castanea sativa]|uniref:uncharacterized protein LOC142608413 n=1 Tax=Castanea sativa TaxID=21020 RepID=UPI003F64C3E5
MMDNVYRVKMIQLAKPMISGTILIRATQDTLGIIKHSITLLRGRWELRMDLMEEWRLRDTKDASSLSHFNTTTTPNRIVNILIWNCRGAMKPLFRKTVMDLVAWHSPIIMVITETRLSGARAKEIIETLPFDRAEVIDSIGFVGGISLLWSSNLVHVDILATTEQEIHAIIWEPAEGNPQ